MCRGFSRDTRFSLCMIASLNPHYHEGSTAARIRAGLLRLGRILDVLSGSSAGRLGILPCLHARLRRLYILHEYGLKYRGEPIYGIHTTESRSFFICLVRVLVFVCNRDRNGRHLRPGTANNDSH